MPTPARLAALWLAVLGGLCSAVAARAQVAPTRIGRAGGEREAVSQIAVPQQIHVTPELLRRTAYGNIHTHIARLRTLTALVTRSGAQPQVGDTHRFEVRSVLDFSMWREVTAVLLYRSPRVHLWMETHEAQALRAKQFLQPLLDSLALRLEERTPEGSLAPSQGLLTLERRYLGRPPNVDGDGALDVLLLNIRDHFKETGAYVAGFFDPNDLTTRAHSNRRDLLYVDTRPTLFYEDRLRVGEAAATIAHEYQHLIHANYEAEEPELTFINEGLSEWAEILCGFPPRPVTAYFHEPGRSLPSWNYEAPLPDYARASLFVHYLFEQIGPEYADALIQSPKVGLEGIRHVLRQAGGPSFETLFTNWGYALFLSDRSIDPAYGYRHPARRAVRFTGAYVFDALPQAHSVPLPPLSHVPLAFPLIERLTLHAPVAADLALAARATYPRGTQHFEAGLQLGAPVTATQQPFGSLTTLLSNVSASSRASDTSRAALHLLAEGDRSGRRRVLAYDDGLPDPFSGAASFLLLDDPGEAVALAFASEEKAWLYAISLKVIFASEISGSGVPPSAPRTATLQIRRLEDGRLGAPLTPPITRPLRRPFGNLKTTNVLLSKFYGDLRTVRDSFAVVLRSGSAANPLAVALDRTAEPSSAGAAFHRADGDERWQPMRRVRAESASLKGFRPMLRAHVAIRAHALPNALRADFAYECWKEGYVYYVSVPDKHDGIVGVDYATWEEGDYADDRVHNFLFGDDGSGLNNTGYNHAEMVYAKRRFSSANDPARYNTNFRRGAPNPPMVNAENWVQSVFNKSLR